MNRGDWFRVLSRPGMTFQFMYERNGEITAFGGSKNPEGQRQYETFKADTNFIPCPAPFIKRKDRDE